ncbi:kinase-like domain-containing protein [Xylariales sp. PMI_506]|nr:kinase-like domain-containing protein [Xylariales sp. PMI_506]
MWWDATRIEATVTRQFVASHLSAEEAGRLDQAPGFGEGLTDETYWEWIEGKAKRIFLTLVDAGIPNRIFGAVDHSWDDDDLPIPFPQVERVTATKDSRINHRFYDRQFFCLIRYLEKGCHIDYNEDEVVPLEVLDRRQVTGLGHSPSVDRVGIPNTSVAPLYRRRVPLGDDPGTCSEHDFLAEITRIKDVQNDHIVSYFASYTYEDHGYVLFTPATDYSLKTVIAGLPPPLKALAKEERRNHVMNWIHCLSDTLCYLHNAGRSHGNIKPSTVHLTSDHRIALGTTSRLSPEDQTSSSDRVAFDRESYDYAAPEQWYRPLPNAALYRKAAAAVANSVSNNPFAINRGESATPIQRVAMPTPKLNAQAADVFSLGCIIVELLSLQLKRPPRAFAAHRAAKHKQAGRGGAVLDSSFHKNLGQVEAWMEGLAKDAAKKEREHPVFRGVAPTLQIAARMLSAVPQDRPTAAEVEQRIYRVLREQCGIPEPHCVHGYGSFDFGLQGLRISSGSSSGRSGGDGGEGEGEEGDGVADAFSISGRRQSRVVGIGSHRLSGSGGRSGVGRDPQSPRFGGFHFHRGSSPARRAGAATPLPEDGTWEGPVYGKGSRSVGVTGKTA